MQNNDKKPRKMGIIVFIIMAILVLIALIFNIQNASVLKEIKGNFGENAKTVKLHNMPHSDYIAVLHIKGVIEESNDDYDQKWLIDTINDLKDDKNNQGIMLCVDSPGGGVFQADEAYLTLLDYKAKGKVIYAYFTNMAASGAYYISCAASKIYANRNCLTGSIGVIMTTSLDLSELLKNLGIKTTTIHSGRNKNMGDISKPFTSEQQQIMQSICDECYEQFTSIVATSRDMDIEEVKQIADGRVYSAKQALSCNLIDGIMPFVEDALDIMQKEEFSNNKLEIKHLEREHKQTFYDYLMGTKATLDKISSLLSTGTLASKSSIQYLYVQ